MNEIDLTKTPLSEVDLSKIDYEKSYVMFKGNKYLIIENTLKQSSYEHDFVLYSLGSKPWRGFLFYPDGKHYYNKATIHLFYKEEKGCGNCQYICTLPYNDPCCKCDTINHPFWQPKEVKERPAGEWKQVNSHPIIIEYQDLGDKVKIVKIEGVMTHNEIQKHANHSVYLEYFGGMHMFMSANKKELILVTKSIPVTTKYDIGCTISKMRFEALINFMKLSAKRLALLIKDSKEPKIERIII
jgi:hypothetical protein